MLRRLAVITACWWAALAGAGTHAPRPLEVGPAEWGKFAVQWRGTWEETLAANPEAAWQAQAAGKPGMAQAAGQVVALRRVELLRAMVERFPARRDRHAEAYRVMASTCGQAGLRWWASYYGWKLATEFPERKDLLAEAYQWMLAYQFGSAGDPDGREWEPAMGEVLALAEAGAIPPAGELVQGAAFGLQRLIVQERRYDLAAEARGRLERLGAKSPILYNAASRLLAAFGHVREAVELDGKSGPVKDWKAGDAAACPAGVLGGLPDDYEMKAQWEALAGGVKVRGPDKPVRPEDVQKILSYILRTEAYMDASPSHYVSFTVLMDQMLGKLAAPRMALLRRSHDQAVGTLARQLAAMRAWEELTALSRRYPWGRSVHEALVEAGELALREGRRHWAAAAFEDVLTHADDPSLRGEATVGLWLAGAQEGGAGVRETMAAVPDDTPLPWAGRQMPAGEVKKQVLAQAGAAGVAPGRLADLKRRVVALPANWPAWETSLDGPRGDGGRHASWPVTQVQTAGEALLVWGPGRLAWFAGAGPAAWVSVVGAWAGAAVPVSVNPPAEGRPERVGPSWQEAWRRPASVRGGRSPAVSDDGRRAYRLAHVYVDALEGGFTVVQRTGVEAVETATGRLLWSTVNLGGWGGLTAMTEPAAADGRVYVLAVAPNAQVTPWVLVCADAANGRMLWSRSLGWQANTSADLARGGGAVTIHQGAVYCGTNAGTLARCDARDGAMSWVRGYPGAVAAGAGAPNFSREGSSPIVAGGVLLAAPRDYSGVMAFRAATGEAMWQAPMVPSDRLAGLLGKAVIAVNDRWVCALEVSTGARLWCRAMPGGTGGQAAIVGDGVVVVSDGALHRLSGATGETLERLELAGGPVGEPVLLEDGTLVEAVIPAPAGPHPRLAAGGGPLGVPMEQAWFMPCQRPSLVLADGEAGDAALGVVAGRRVAGVRRVPAWEPAWQRLLHGRPQAAAIVGDQLVTAVGGSLRGFGTADGAGRWSVGLPFAPADLGGDGRSVYATSGAAAWTWAAMVDAVGGRLLWSRSLAERLHAQSNAAAAGLVRMADGSAGLRLYWPAMLFGDVGVRPGATTLEAAGGTLRQVERFLPGQERWPAEIVFDAAGVRYIGQDGRLYVRPHAGGGQSGAAARPIEAEAKARFPGHVGLRGTPAGTYVRAIGGLYFTDAATGRETAYVLPESDQPGESLVLDFREMGTSLVVVSGVTGNDPTVTYTKHGRVRVPYDIARSRMCVDFFDRPTGQHLGRQVLGGVHFCESGYTGFASQARVFPDSIVVTDERGLYLYRPHEGAVRAYADAAAALAGLRRTMSQRPAQLAAFQAADDRVLQAIDAFRRVMDAGGVRLPAADRAALTGRIAGNLTAMRAEILRPELTPAAAAYIETTSLTIATGLAGAEIRYTLDGSDPVTKGKVYTGPVPLPEVAHVRVAADLPGRIGPASPSAEGRYRKVPARAADAVGGVQTGLAYTFHKSRVDTVTKIAARPVNDRGVVENFSVARWRGKDFFGVIFTGYLKVPADGIYRFHLASDDGSQFFIGDKLICNYDGRHPPKGGVWATVGLRAGYHAVKMLYFDDIGDESLLLEYEGPGVPRREVPASALFHKP